MAVDAVPHVRPVDRIIPSTFDNVGYVTLNNCGAQELAVGPSIQHVHALRDDIDYLIHDYPDISFTIPIDHYLNEIVI